MSIDESEFPDDFKRGLAAIREREVEDAEVVAVENNFAYIAIGRVSLPDIYRQGEAEVYVRVPLTFPKAKPYGVVTDPYLHRKDGGAIERYHRNHANTRPVQQALGLAESGFFSWDWKGMPLRRPEDMAAAVEWARKRVREG